MSVLVPAQFPSLSAVFMAAAASILLLFIARVLFLLMRIWSCPMVRTESEQKEIPWRYSAPISNPWGRSLQWNILPVSLPFTLALSEKRSVEVGSDVAQKRPQTLFVGNWQPRARPQFQPPPPALYESPVPLSMAKIIMSRHTFRKPNSNRPRRPSITSSPWPTSPPQTPSSLYHSIA